jgi:hypothetical protein
VGRVWPRHSGGGWPLNSVVRHFEEAVARLFPGIFYAILAAIPGWIIGALLAAPRMRELPPSELVLALAKGSAFFLLFFGIITLVYGSAVWTLLRMAGLLNLASLVVASLLPVIAYVAWSLLTRGYDSGWPGPVIGFGIPALFIGVALWWFTVGGGRNA